MRSSRVMRINPEEHKRAFLSNFELACEFGVLICIADLLWLAYDIISNGLSITYCLIGIMLLIGLFGTLYVLIRHHKTYTHRIFIKQLKKKRLKRNKPVKNLPAIIQLPQQK